VAQRKADMKTQIFKELVAAVDKYCAENEDGDTGTHKLVERYCELHGIPEWLGNKVLNELWKEWALSAGIPLSVIELRTKLLDHFSEEYIASQIGIKK